MIKKLAFVNLDDISWNHNRHYHKYLLSKIPYPCEMALDIGCGNGELCRLMAGRSKNIFGVDLSDERAYKTRRLYATKRYS
ncbi:methyltransferase domain-containing protein [Bacillaceae bacterium Marseille-Q3522]|nr:methyltransferase domain-containing protein [Bacillaceae bacterium Marseille-Q3522]